MSALPAWRADGADIVCVKTFGSFCAGPVDLIVLGRYGSLSALLFRCLSLRFQGRGGSSPKGRNW
ncbi:MAG: hypothetical protein MPL62_17050 [Alphaproteobacteria bacterium]|nr:hypothetical protein [Alphaproteobacteria bacterium]